MAYNVNSTTIIGATNNGVLTSNGSSSGIVANSGLIYDGYSITISGDLNTLSSHGNVKIQGAYGSGIQTAGSTFISGGDSDSGGTPGSLTLVAGHNAIETVLGSIYIGTDNTFIAKSHSTIIDSGNDVDIATSKAKYLNLGDSFSNTVGIHTDGPCNTGLFQIGCAAIDFLATNADLTYIIDVMPSTSGNSIGGGLQINSGMGAGSGHGGYLTLEAGFGGPGATAGDGGFLYITGGNGNGGATASGNGGYVEINGGAGGTHGKFGPFGNGGGVEIFGGNSNLLGGPVTITGGQGGTNAGNVTILGGPASGSGTSGNVFIDLSIDFGGPYLAGNEPQIAIGTNGNGPSIYIGSKDSTPSQYGNNIYILQQGYGNLKVGAGTLEFTPASSGETPHTVYDHTIRVSDRNAGGQTAGSLTIASGKNTLQHSGSLHLITPPAGSGEGSNPGDIYIMSADSGVASPTPSGSILMDTAANGSIYIGAYRTHAVEIGAAVQDHVIIGNPSWSQITMDTSKFLLNAIGYPMTFSFVNTPKLIISTKITIQDGATLNTTGSGTINLPNNVSSTFQIEGTSVSSTVTAAALNVLTAGPTSNADGYHTHAVQPGSFVKTFTYADLVAGVLTVNHGLVSQYPVVEIYDGYGQLVVPNSVTATSSIISTVNLSGFGAIYGTWHAVVVSSGTATGAFVKAFTNTDIVGNILTVTHNLNNQYNTVQVYRNDGYAMLPDNILAIDANSLQIHLQSAVPITGTWFAVIGGALGSTGRGGISSITSVTFAQSPYAVLNTDRYLSIDPTGGAITINLPAYPGIVQQIMFKNRTTSTTAITVNRAGSQTIEGATSLTMNTSKAAVTLTYNSATTDWEIS